MVARGMTSQRTPRESADTIPVGSGLNSATQPDPGPGDSLDGALASAGQFGRFTILDTLGSGGMGIVYAAYDPQLDRKVAIKVLRTDMLSAQRREREAARLLREARSMAQLQHPHVVTVYEAGTIDNRVYVAMEYIVGQTLRKWLESGKRSVPEILEVFVKAGRGLAAGHAAGLIHRDFKPDNVLIGEDGRVRVIDFGLARPVGESEAEEAAGMFGTPMYMAPEQHDHRALDARTDQFSFCVSLFEALHGAPPFMTQSYAEMVDAISRDSISAPPPNPDVTPRVLEAIKRGLRADPDQRFPRMETLLDELAPPIAKRPGAVIAAIAIGGVVAAAATLLIVHLSANPPDPCAGGTERLAGAWDADIRHEIDVAFRASHRTHAADTIDRVDRAFDAYAKTWVARRQAVCEATKVRHEQSDLAFDMRMQCLSAQLAQLRALTGLFAHADVATVDYATEAALDLPSPDACAKLSLGAIPPPTAAQRQPVAEISDEIGEIHANLSARRYAPMIDKAAALVERAKQVGYSRTTGQARYMLAIAQSGASKPVEAERSLREAIEDCARAKDDQLLAEMWITMVYVVGHQLAHYTDALTLLPAAEAAVHRVDDPPDVAGNLAYQVAAAHFTKGEYALATTSFESAVELEAKAWGRDTPELAHMQSALGGAYLRTANLVRAKSAFEKSLAMMERTLGPSHPDVAIPLANIGGLAQAMGDFEAATKYHQRALAILEEIHGENDTDVGLTVYSLAVSANGREDYKGAIPYYERALHILEKVSPDHPNVGLALVGLADCREEVGQAAQAVDEGERGLALVEKAAGDPVQLALARYVLAKALWSAGRDHPRALALATQARDGFAAGGVATLNAQVAVANWFKKTQGKP